MPLIFLSPATVALALEFDDEVFDLTEVFVFELAAEFDDEFVIELPAELVIEFVVFETFVVDMFDTLVFAFIVRFAFVFELFVAEPPHANANAETIMIKPVYNFIKYVPFVPVDLTQKPLFFSLFEVVSEVYY